MLGQIQVVVANLTAGVTLWNPTDTTTASGPTLAGLQFATANPVNGRLAPGQVLNLVLEFVNPSMLSINYTVTGFRGVAVGM